MKDRLQRGYGRLMHWMDDHWGMRETFLSIPAAMLLVIWTTFIMLGATEAYHVDSAAEIATPVSWGEVLSQANESDSVLVASLYVLVGAFGVAWIEVGGRIVYEYLLWVPEGAWTGLSYMAIAVATGVIGLNTLYICHLNLEIGSGERAGGDIDG